MTSQLDQIRDSDAERFSYACKVGDFENIREIWSELCSAVKPQHLPPYGYLEDALVAAVRENQFDVIAFILDQSPQSLPCDEAVEIATKISSIPIFELFLEHGANINRRILRHAPTYIGVAARHDSHKLIRWLLARGADMNKPYLTSNRTALSIAAAGSNIETVTLLLEGGGDLKRSSVLIAAVQSDKPKREEMLRYLIEQGAPMDAIDCADDPRYFDRRKGSGLGTALHAAVRLSNPHLKSILLEAGADPNIKNTVWIMPAELSDQMRR